jgi:hypothetical protein
MLRHSPGTFILHIWDTEVSLCYLLNVYSRPGQNDVHRVHDISIVCSCYCLANNLSPKCLSCLTIWIYISLFS